MASERQPPDGEHSVTNLSGSYLDLVDDPDSPDGNWMVASGNNVNTSTVVTFDTPSGNPTVGADLQEFKAWVEQFDEGQGGTPEIRLELWENGGLVRAGSDESVPDGGHLISFTWNASDLGTADGSLVECALIGTKSGGSPGNRNTINMGAVEWNVEYDAAAAAEFAADITGTGTVAGALTTEIKAKAAITGTGTVAGALTTEIKAKAAISGQATAQGTLNSDAIEFAAAVTGSATADGALTTAITAKAAILGSATADGALTTAITAKASVTGTGTMVGALTVVAGVTGRKPGMALDLGLIL